MMKLFFVNKFYFYAPKNKEVSEIAKIKLDRMNREVLKIIPMLKKPHWFGIFINAQAFEKYAKLAEEYLALAENEQWI